MFCVWNSFCILFSLSLSSFLSLFLWTHRLFDHYIHLNACDQLLYSSVSISTLPSIHYINFRIVKPIRSHNSLAQRRHYFLLFDSIILEWVSVFAFYERLNRRFCCCCCCCGRNRTGKDWKIQINSIFKRVYKSLFLLWLKFFEKIVPLAKLVDCHQLNDNDKMICLLSTEFLEQWNRNGKSNHKSSDGFCLTVSLHRINLKN